MNVFWRGGPGAKRETSTVKSPRLLALMHQAAAVKDYFSAAIRQFLEDVSFSGSHDHAIVCLALTARIG